MARGGGTRLSQPNSASGRSPAAARAHIVRAARGLFGTLDPASITLDEIARVADVELEQVRALYPTLIDVFTGVYQQVQAELSNKIFARLTSPDPIELMREGIAAWLEATADPEACQIMLISAPVVLGWDRWREAGNKYGSMLIDAALVDGMDKGVVREQPVGPLAAVVVGCLESAAIYASRQPDRELGLAQARAVLDQVLAGIARG